jgi:HEAT repeat protein
VKHLRRETIKDFREAQVTMARAGRIFFRFSLASILACLTVAAVWAEKKPKAPAVDKLQQAENLRQGRSRATPEKIKGDLAAEQNPLVRVRLHQALNAAGGEDPAPHIAALASDPSPLVRQAAAIELGKLAQASGAVQALAQALETETDPAVRYACANALAHADTPESLAALDKASQDPDPALRRQAAASLQRHTSPQAKKILRKLEKDEDNSVRGMAKGGPQ